MPLAVFYSNVSEALEFSVLFVFGLRFLPFPVTPIASKCRGEGDYALKWSRRTLSLCGLPFFFFNLAVVYIYFEIRGLQQMLSLVCFDSPFPFFFKWESFLFLYAWPILEWKPEKGVWFFFWNLIISSFVVSQKRVLKKSSSQGEILKTWLYFSFGVLYAGVQIPLNRFDPPFYFCLICFFMASSWFFEKVLRWFLLFCSKGSRERFFLAFQPFFGENPMKDDRFR